MHVLIIDDERAVADTLADSVRSEGNSVAVAYSGADALALIAEGRPDAVFLDLVMPDIGGVAILREIRGRYPDLPVVIVTGWATAEDVEEAKRLGVTEIVEKPWALKQVDRALQRLERKER